MTLSSEQAAIVADRQRLWEVRKYCQVKPSLATRKRNAVGDERVDKHPPTAESSRPDAALTSLLRCLVLQLDVDIAMVSLLDDHSQYFLAGAGKDSIDSARITLESTRWYGCDTVDHHGGLCERTITLDTTQHPAIYEELDMARNCRTETLPFVNGDIARFRHYAGAPVSTSTGARIGTVFTMSTKPSSGLNVVQQNFLTETACNVMHQLEQAVQVLEGERLMRYHSATARLSQAQNFSQHQWEGSRTRSAFDQESDRILGIYEHAAGLIRESFGFDGLCFQAAPASHQGAQGTRQVRILSASLAAGIRDPASMTSSELDKLTKSFPYGGMFRQLGGDQSDWFMLPSHEDSGALDLETSLAFNRSFQGARQILCMPLFDVVRNRTAAICIGWLNDYTRVYSDKCDLSSMSAFCTTTILEVLRLESQKLDRIKSDFLGSISHEMRSPLHNTLGNLELLLQTDCDNEQRELTINAKFGATQLLETIDKILQYTNISSRLDTSSNAALKMEASHSEDEVLQIGPQDRYTGGATGVIDFISLCEAVVEDTTMRMRLFETIMSPTNEHEEDERSWPRSLAAHCDLLEKDPFSIVMFDAKSTENFQLPENTGFRIVLENLLSNAIKYTRAGCCARVFVELLPSTAKLTVSDCGYGMTEEFIRHNLYVPFAQQDPIADGIGLGLSLIKRNLDSLGGTIQIETDRALGTTAKVSVEIERLANGVIQKSGAGNGRLNGTATIPSLLKQPKDKLPVLKACFYAPSTWIRRYDKRDERSIDLVYRSLSRTLSEWFQPVLSIWQQQEDREPPDLVFISQRNLATFMEECGEKFANVKKVVICAATSKDSVKDREMVEEATAVADALIIGAVLPSKLWKVVTVFFPRILPPCTPGATQDDTSQAQKPISGDLDTPHSNHQKQPHDAGERNIILSSSASVTTTSPDRGAQPLKDFYNGQNQVPEACKEVDEISPHAEYRPKAEAHMNATPNRAILSSGHTTFEALPAAKHGSADILRKSRTVPLPQSSAQPRLLLVDDNSVNLKMLGMFVNKCGIPGTTSTSVRGGKEAITAFEEANAGGSDVAPGFDIIFMDLSMPEVSGFDATASIRRIEAASNNDRRAFIVALTGLVSDKDRNAAFEAGVDDYVTKPAGLESVRKIIQAWVAKQKSSP